MRIRLYVENKLTESSDIVLNEKQTHYLFHVLKQKSGDFVYCFDNQSGEFECVIVSIDKKVCKISIGAKIRTFETCPDIWLLFAPVKKDNTDFIIEKATELGARKIIPIISQRTINDKINSQRFYFQAIEASEQCRRVDLPEISESIKLGDLLKNWDKSRTLFFMDETLVNGNVLSTFSDKSLKGKPCAILTGPEGGFTQEELNLLRSLKFTKAVGLGKRILRAETAAIAALSCWQAISGDWKND